MDHTTAPGSDRGWNDLFGDAVGGSLRSPISGRSTIDDLALHADRRRTAVAEQRLATAFDPVTVLLEARKPDLPSPSLLTTALQLEAADARALLDHTLTFEDNRPPRLGFIPGPDGQVDDRVGFRTNYDLFRPDVAEIDAKLRSGSGCALLGVQAHHPRLQDLVDDLDQTLDGSSHADLLVAGSHGKIPSPWQPERSWLVLPLDAPVSAIPADGTPPVTAEGGQALVLDLSAMLHTAPGGHVLRIAIPQTTWTEVDQILLERANRHPLFRADLPTDLDAPTTSYGGTLLDQGNTFRQALAELVDHDLLAMVEGRRRARSRSASSPGLLDALALLSGEARCVRFTGRPVLAAAHGKVRLVFAGRTLLTSDPAAEALASHHDGSWWDARSVLDAAAMSPADADQLLHALLAAGALSVQARPGAETARPLSSSDQQQP